MYYSPELIKVIHSVKTSYPGRKTLKSSIYINEVQCQSDCVCVCHFHSGDFIFKTIFNFFSSYRASAREWFNQNKIKISLIFFD